MNSNRLREIVDKLTDANKRLEISSLLDTVQSSLSNLVSSPSDASYQSNLAKALGEFRAASTKLTQEFQPGEIDRLMELQGTNLVLEDAASLVNEWIAENPATPAVAQEKLNTLIAERNAFVAQAEQLSKNLDAFGVTSDPVKPGEAEIGFLLPRDLFNNEFDRLIKELSVINRIVRAFSEASTGSAEPIEVRQISTTDPIFSLGMCAATIIGIGRAITWALDTWKKVEEIRNVRAQTAQIEALKDSPVEKYFDESITKTIEIEVKKEVEHILAQTKGDDGRKNEQRTDLTWALESVLARVERGMTVEIRSLPPPLEEAAEGEDVDDAQAQYQSLREVSAGLVFPEMTGTPVLKLPPMEPRKQSSKAATAT